MTADSSLHVALAFDHRFWAPAYATMRSICLHTRRRADLRFHLCHPALPAGIVADLEAIATEFGATLLHHNIDADESYVHFAATLPHTRYITAVAYARMLLDRIIDPTIERIAYIDCDILIRAPIEELLAADLKGMPLGAVKEPHAVVFRNGRDAQGDRDLLDPADPYFNSGLLVIDLEAWRAIGMSATLKRIQDEGILKRLTNDQQILNYVFRGRWTEIERSWNTFAVNPAVEVLDPKGVHYTGLQKPWNLVTYLPFGRVYRHVMTNAIFYRFMRERWARWWRSRIGLRD